jgi:hypothetical protein
MKLGFIGAYSKLGDTILFFWRHHKDFHLVLSDHAHMYVQAAAHNLA